MAGMRLRCLPLQHLLLAASMPLRYSRRSIVSMCAEEFPLITSSTNPRLKLIKRLHTKKHREREGLVLLARARSPRQPAQWPTAARVCPPQPGRRASGW